MRPRALLIDALGTLIALVPPAPALRSLLRSRFAVEVSEQRASEALSAEIAYYREHLGEGRDGPSLDALRRRCALVLRDALAVGPALAEAPGDELTRLLLDSLAFRAYDDAAPALRAAHAAGVRTVAASNWDISLPDTLLRTGLLGLLDGVVTSAACGAAKPDPALFAEALRVAGASAPQAIHVGDSLLEDVEGARAAGVEPLLLLRGGQPAPPGVEVIRSLAALPARLSAPAARHAPAGAADP